MYSCITVPTPSWAFIPGGIQYPPYVRLNCYQQKHIHYHVTSLDQLALAAVLPSENSSLLNFRLLYLPWSEEDLRFQCPHADFVA